MGSGDPVITELAVSFSFRHFGDASLIFRLEISDGLYGVTTRSNNELWKANSGISGWRIAQLA
jgi:hypothetical protein